MSLRAVAAVTVLFAAIAAAHADDVSPVSAGLCQSMRTRGVMSARPAVGCDRLALVRFAYVGFDGRPRDDGQLVVLDAVAHEVLAIFRTLRGMRFPLARATPIDAFGGDDDASMAANNTSAFNDRTVAGRNAISVHAYGCAIDLNPVQNPYVTKSETSPPAGAAFRARQPLRPGMAERVVAVFARHGFSTWGGRWRSETDYQHFAVDRDLARRLVALPSAQARALFEARVRHRR